ncbi:unnamed protein product [Closterium sp. NIES-53]
MHNGASRANHLRAFASVRTAVFYGATLDSRSAAALAHRRPAVLAGCLSAVLARLLYATMAGGRPCYARDYELHSLDFSTAFLQGSLHEEIWLRRPLGFTGSFPAGTQWSLRWPVYGLRHAPREWHDTLRTTLAALGFAPSSADPSLFLRTDNTLPPFYVLVYVDDLVFATADTESLALVKAELQERYTCTDLGELRVASLVLTGHSDASWADDQATQRSSQGYTFSLGSGSVSWRSTHSSSVLGSSCEAEIYAGAMAAQELRWLTYLVTDLGERPRSPPVLYVNNKAMLAL